MNRRIMLCLGVVLLALGLVVLWKPLIDSGRGSNSTIAKLHADVVRSNLPTAHVVAGGGSSSNEAAHAALGSAIEALGKMLEKSGARRIGTVEAELEGAVKSGDRGAMLRAFNDACYGYSARPASAIPAFKAYLVHEDPFLRYLAAEHLYLVGDTSGYETLIALAQASNVIHIIYPDIRMKAAATLAKYRDIRARDAIYSLFEARTNFAYRTCLELLGASQAVARIVTTMGNRMNGDLAVMYGRLNAVAAIPQLERALSSERIASDKASAAWALWRITQKGEYVDYLMKEMGKALVVPTNGRDYDYGPEVGAFRVAASVADPRIVEILENCLDSRNPVLRESAFASLMIHHGGTSPKLKTALLDELNSRTKRLPLEFLAQIAAQSKDPDIRAAGFSWDKLRGEHFFENWAVRRADWPIYSWAEDHVFLP